jgi:hypothetical protein
VSHTGRREAITAAAALAHGDNESVTNVFFQDVIGASQMDSRIA